VDRRSPPADKIALFRALFSGRDDVFAMRWQNDRTGRSGWSPAVVGGWVNSKRPDRSYEPFTDAVIEQHLAGEIAAGLYPLLRDDRCRLLACDFDGGSWALDALTYLDACRAAGLPAVLERSRSGECHHLPARSFELAVRDARCRRWVGLTATPYRRDGLEAVITMQCGPVRHEIALADTAAAKLTRRLHVHETRCSAGAREISAIQDAFRALVTDEARTRQIAADIAAAVKEGRNVLVLTQWTEHLDALATLLEQDALAPLVLKGGLGKKARAAVIEQLNADDAPSGQLLLATGSYVGEGFDSPSLDSLFLAFPLAFKGRVVQYIGRILRTSDTKTDVEVHDYLDPGLVFRKMHSKRLATYAALGFDTGRSP
jgi:hypothetical protein